MNEAVFEQYREALRRGHIAAQRGRLDLAIDAYAEAATLAPDRPVAHASLGGVLARLGRTDDALTAYDRALERAPRDEQGLAGRADALIAARRRIEAANTLDLLSDVQEAARRLADACDSARRALEQAESRNRRRHVKDLVARLREIGGQGAEAAIGRAMDVLEPSKLGTDGRRGIGAVDLEPPEEAPSEPPPNGVVLVTEALDALDAGDREAARTGLVAAARAHAQAGQDDAALDACYLALSFAPDDVETHLALVDLYVGRGWRNQAAEKLLLLGRMVDLTGDTLGRNRVGQAASANFSDDPRLAGLQA